MFNLIKIFKHNRAKIKADEMLASTIDDPFKV